MQAILIEDDADLRSACAQSFELADIDVAVFSEAEPALSIVGAGFDGVCVSDVRLPGMSGLDFAARIRAIDPEIPVILMTGHGDIRMAVEAIREGAYDFIEKPFAPDRLIESVRRGLEMRRLVLENRNFRNQLTGRDGLDARLVGESAATRALKDRLLAVAAADTDVLLFGETGTGKEICARALHDFGPRAGKPFVPINCGALPETVVESELFGHEQGAFTGAIKRRVGKFEHANGGTIFLDEIESMPPSLQIKLLRVLQERVVEPIGGNRTVPIDVRIVAATKTDLRAAADAGAFREDLLYRLDIVTVSLPTLRERWEDIPLLFQHFVNAFAAAKGRAPEEPAPDLLSTLSSEAWPGNVRELRNRAERYVLGLMDAPKTTDRNGTGPDSALSLHDRVDRFEKDAIEAALAETGGVATDAARQLGIGRKTLYDKMTKHGIDRARFSQD